MKTTTIPKFSLVVLVGATGSGKSTFAARHFLPTEVLSSDAFRALVGDDENDQSVTAEAFQALHAVAAQRLSLGRMTVIDATNVQPEARRPLVELAREYHVLPVAIVLDVPEKICLDRTAARTDRDAGPGVVRRQCASLSRSVGRLEREGFRRVVVLRGVAEVDAAQITARTGVGRPLSRVRAVRHHRRCAWLPMRTGRRCSAARLPADGDGRAQAPRWPVRGLPG